MWYWRKLLRVPWTAKRSNSSILKEISPEYSLEGLILKLKFQYFGHLMWSLTHWERPWCWKRYKAEEEGDDRGWDGWMASPTRWIWIWVSSRSWWWTGKPGVLQSMGSQRVRHDWVTDIHITPTAYLLANYHIYIHISAFRLLKVFKYLFPQAWNMEWISIYFTTVGIFLQKCAKS